MYNTRTILYMKRKIIITEVIVILESKRMCQTPK